MTAVNPLRWRWAEGGAVHGAWSMLPSSVAAEALARGGADYVCVDLQHGAVDYSDAVPMFQAVAAGGAWPLARVPANDAAAIGRVLDAGALGVLVPMVSSAQDAARAVAACRYPPRGVRSFGPSRAAWVHGSSGLADLEQVVCAVMVETRDGLDRVDEIAATPGLDAIYVGPADLAVGLGLPPVFEQDEGPHVAAIQAVREACARHGIVAGIHCADGAMAARREAQGFRMMTAVTDLSLVSTGALQEIARARGAEAAGTAAPADYQGRSGTS